MNIWKGIDKEGSACGTDTLFVESRILSKARLLIIKSFLTLFQIKRIYFGANRKNLWYVDSFIDSINCTKILECSKMPSKKIAQKFDSIILRTDFPKTMTLSNVVAKFDNKLQVKMFDKEIITDLKELSKQGMYKTDFKIY